MKRGRGRPVVFDVERLPLNGAKVYGTSRLSMKSIIVSRKRNGKLPKARRFMLRAMAAAKVLVVRVK